jgi:hypothetical protein
MSDPGADRTRDLRFRNWKEDRAQDLAETSIERLSTQEYRKRGSSQAPGRQGPPASFRQRRPAVAR